MKNSYTDYIYSEQDIYKAFDMGFQTAINAFEKCLGITPEGQIHLIDELKKMLYEKKKAENQKKIFPPFIIL